MRQGLSVPDMEEIAFWSEIGISGTKEAERKYQRIRLNEALVPFSQLDDQIQEFIAEVSKKYPGLIVAPEDGADLGDSSFSIVGVLIRFDNELPNTVIPDAFEIAGSLGLSMYDPVQKFALGTDDSDEVVVEK